MRIIEEKDQLPLIPEREGYVAFEKTVNAIGINIWALAIGFPVLTIATAIHLLLWKDAIMEQILNLNVRFCLLLGLGFIIAITLVMFLFELFHGIAWCLLSGIPMNRIRFCMAGNGLLFQCRIDGELLTKRDFVRGLIVPDILFTLVLLIPGLWMNWPVATLTGALVIMCAVGDIMIVNKVRSERDDTLVYIHPKQAGVYAYHKETE